MKKAAAPVRQCLACRKKRPQGELVRIRARGSTAVIDDKREKYTGRSCYSCPEKKCLDVALKKDRLERALRNPVSVIPSKDEILKGLEDKG
ncbi:DUF448 domain-containing protein [Candidatus Micrarchaeota archaeon]|nr:DUF448 domain-containing protein [Candidatus Micrarchaeota archaeon]